MPLFSARKEAHDVGSGVAVFRILRAIKQQHQAGDPAVTAFSLTIPITTVGYGGSVQQRLSAAVPQ